MQDTLGTEQLFMALQYFLEQHPETNLELAQ